MVIDAFEAAGLVDSQQMNLSGFRIDLKDVAEPFYGRALKNISVKDVYEQVMRLVFKYRIRLPRNLLLLLKTFIQTEALGKILDSEASLLEVTRPYAKRLLEQGYEARKILKSMGREAKAAGGLLRGLPKLTHEFIRRLARGEHRLALEHSGLEQVSRKFELGLNRLTVGMVIAASLIAASLILNSAKSVMILRFNFLGVQTMAVTELLGLTGYCVATVLGLWLIFSIFRSGKL
jgi:ubiquinone biosynthesis protein